MQPFSEKIRQLGAPLARRGVDTLQVNLGRYCNLACIHCHGQVLAQALQKLDSVGVRAKQLPPWFDVDTIDELQRVLLLRGSSRRAMRNTLPLLHGRILKHGKLSQKQRAKAS